MTSMGPNSNTKGEYLIINGENSDNMEEGLPPAPRSSSSMYHGHGEAYTTPTCGSFLKFCHQCSNIDEQDAQTMHEDVYSKKLLYTGIESAVAGGYCYWFQFIIHNKYCNTIFRCGCIWNWEGGWVDCNFHNTDGSPKCPWCKARASIAWTTTFLPFVLMFMAYIFTLYHRKNYDYILLRFTVSTLVYFVSASLVGLIFFLADKDYPDFFVKDVRWHGQGLPVRV